MMHVFKLKQGDMITLHTTNACQLKHVSYDTPAIFLYVASLRHKHSCTLCVFSQGVKYWTYDDDIDELKLIATIGDDDG